MEVLSEVLKAVKLDGALFFNAEFSAPWCFSSPSSPTLAPYLSAASKHVIIFHLLTDGQGYAHVEGDDRSVSLTPGDVVVFPHGDPHVMRNGPVVKTVNYDEEIRRVLSQELKVSRMGGSGEITKFICGYMTCEPQLCRVALGGLPHIIKINIRDGAAGQWLEQSIRHSVDHVDGSKPGGEAVLAKLSEVLFVETLRRYIALLPQEQTGWLAGVRDPEVGKALALLHRQPANPWTIASLANEVGISRSVLSERFRRYLSETPIAYLTRWRLQLGARQISRLRLDEQPSQRHTIEKTPACWSSGQPESIATRPCRPTHLKRASAPMNVRFAPTVSTECWATSVKLRWRLHAKTHQAFKELEGEHLSWQGPGKHDGQTPAD